jgi:hypothetical protein
MPNKAFDVMADNLSDIVTEFQNRGIKTNCTREMRFVVLSTAKKLKDDEFSNIIDHIRHGGMAGNGIISILQIIFLIINT